LGGYVGSLKSNFLQEKGLRVNGRQVSQFSVSDFKTPMGLREPTVSGIGCV